jgi:hypothetical protein
LFYLDFHVLFIGLRPKAMIPHDPAAAFSFLSKSHPSLVAFPQQPILPLVIPVVSPAPGFKERAETEELKISRKTEFT